MSSRAGVWFSSFTKTESLGQCRVADLLSEDALPRNGDYVRHEQRGGGEAVSGSDEMEVI